MQIEQYKWLFQFLCWKTSGTLEAVIYLFLPEQTFLRVTLGFSCFSETLLERDVAQHGGFQAEQRTTIV